MDILQGGALCFRRLSLVAIKAMNIAMLQLNLTVGDLAGNANKLKAGYLTALSEGAELVVSTELALCGYPPKDLLDHPNFVTDCQTEAHALKQIIGEKPLILGWPREDGGHLYNAASLIQNGEFKHHYHKMWLPTYDVFDEPRYFSPGESHLIFDYQGHAIALTVCEDIWGAESEVKHRYQNDDPLAQSARAGCDLVINLSASPYHQNKLKRRQEAFAQAASHYKIPILYCNQVGGNDALLFDGRSMVAQKNGYSQVLGPSFESKVIHAHFGDQGFILNVPPQTPQNETLQKLDLLADALTMGIRDYFTKCGFKKAVLGLSGGIDSALSAALAVRALGPKNVMGVAMPSRYSSEGSLSDAQTLASRLGIRMDTLPIEKPFSGLLEVLSEPFAKLPQDVTEENLQARIRGTLLMAYSNKFGALLLTTGNKSELAVGYCTLYGDMNGGLAVISDLYKGEVYALSEHLNTIMPNSPIPESTLTKAPSAELRPDQKDTDSLPEYDILDGILRAYIDERLGPQEIVDRGFDRTEVKRFISMVDRSEYKRRQAAPGLRVSPKAFGEGRRLPIAQGYRMKF